MREEWAGFPPLPPHSALGRQTQTPSRGSPCPRGTWSPQTPVNQVSRADWPLASAPRPGCLLHCALHRAPTPVLDGRCQVRHLSPITAASPGSGPVKPGEAAPPHGPAEDLEATPLRQGRAPHSGLLPPETEQLCGRTLAGSASNQHAECRDPAPGRRLLPAVLRSAARPRRAPRGGETRPSGRGLPWKRRNAISRAFQRQLTRQHSCPVSLDSLRQQLIKHVSESKVTPIWCGPDIRLLEFF